MRRHIIKRWLVKWALATSCVLGGLSIAPSLTLAQAPASNDLPRLPPVEGSLLRPAETIVPSRASISFVPADIPSDLPPVNSRNERIISVVPVNDHQVISPANSHSFTTPAAPARTVPAAMPQTVEPRARVTFPRGEPGLQRRSFIDLTAAPCFAYAADYSWIVGRVEYSNITKSWRLRYTSVDEVDRYGGCVTLIDNQHVKYLTDGMYVRVRGHVVNPNSLDSGPTYYRIEMYEAVDNPNRVQPPERQAASGD